MKIVGLLLKGAIIIYLVIFSVLNAGKVDMVFFFDQIPVSIPLFLVVVLAGVAGSMFTGVYVVVEKFRLGRAVSRLKKDLKTAEEEIRRLRNLPLSQVSMEKAAPEKKAEPEQKKAPVTETDDADPITGS